MKNYQLKKIAQVERIAKKTRKTILNRLLITICIVLVSRIGTLLPIPGISLNDLSFYVQSHTITKNLLTTFSGSKIFIVGLLTLNVFPFINASILVQFILNFSPKFLKLKKENDLRARRVIHRLTRVITLFFSITESISLIVYLKEILLTWDWILLFETVIYLTTGSMIILWLSDLITEYGLGNGVSIFIFINIIANFRNLTAIKVSNSLFLFLLLYATIFLLQGTRYIKIESPNEKNERFWKKSMKGYGLLGRNLNYIPLRYNQTGVMPLVFTTAVLVVPSYFYDFYDSSKFDWLLNSACFKLVYWVIYFALVLIFSLLYSELVLKPKDVSDQLQKMTISIRGLRPGLETIFYLKQIMKRINLVGATILATLATFPNVLELIFNITNLNTLNISSLLIVVGVVLESVNEAENIYYSNIYNDR